MSNITRRTFVVTATGAAVAATSGLPAIAMDAQTIEVAMLNKATDNPRERMVYEPALIRANPGDIIKFVSVDKGHNMELMEGGVPDGVELVKSKASQDFELTVEAEGTYLVKCTPHYATGMVAIIAVGDHTINLDAAKEVRQRGKAKGRFEDLFAELEGGEA
ncbi:MAG: pseudoazurin [Pseudomonadota bacterium]